MDVGAWLTRLGLERYVAAFEENGVDGALLCELTNEDLKDLGVARVAERKRLLKAILELSETKGHREIGSSAPLTSDGERRQVTVLFADLCGFTRLSSGLDSEEVHGLLGAFFETVDNAIDSHGGTIDKHIGDCVMGLFGAPIAHGNDAERAVRAALAIQEAVPRLGARCGHDLQAHVGLASGEVVAAGTGSQGFREYTVTGNSVNLASRLTDHAAPGEILLSESVHRLLADRISAAPLEETKVKGLSRPVRIWRLIGLTDAATSPMRPFVGRRAELGQIKSALAGCREGSSGLTIYIRGEAGIGKTRFADEFARTAAAEGFNVHKGLVLDFGTGKGQDAIRSVVRSMLAVGPGDDPAARRDAAERAVADAMVDAEQRGHLYDLLDLPLPAALRALHDAMDNDARNRAKAVTLCELVRRSAERFPCMILVEDVHWASPIVLAYLARLAETVGQCRALLAMTSRIEGDPIDQPWRSAARGAPLMTIDLGPLRHGEALAFAATTVDASSAFAATCIERAEGNPLFLDQLLRTADDATEAGLPGSIQSVVLARMDKLPPEDRQALHAASILGQRFPLAALQALIANPDYSCAGLVNRLLIRPENGECLFAHALIRDAVYGSLLKARRREMHRRAASWFAHRDAVLHAEHLDRAGDAAAPAAYLAAARAEADAYHMEGARRLIARGLALARDSKDRFALACAHGDVLRDLGATAESIAALEEALRAATDHLERCQARIGLARGMRIADRIDEALAALDTAEAIAAVGQWDLELAWIHHLRGNFYFPLGRVEGCAAEHRLALEYARRAKSDELETRALGGLGDASYAQGRMASAYRNFSDCVELCRAHGYGRIEVANFSMVGHCLCYLNRFEESLESSREAMALARRVGHQRAEIIAAANAIRMPSCMLDIDAANANLDRILELARQIGARRFESEGMVAHAAILALAGRKSEALDLTLRGLETARETGIQFLGPDLLGQLAVLTEDNALRRQSLAEGEELLRAGSVGHNHLRFHRHAIEASLNARLWDEMDRYTQALEDYTRPEPLPWANFWIVWGRGLAAHGRDPKDPAAIDNLNHVLEEAQRIRMYSAIPALRHAIRPHESALTR
jgi:class 3 adenylate cyclase/tetratricopeptide (TPR) repeat protein